MLKLTDKDFLLFRYLFEHEYFPERFIVNYLWGNEVSKSYAKQRLWALRGGKQQNQYTQYIKKNNHPWLNAKIYQPTRKLLKIIKNNSTFFKRFSDVDFREDNYENYISLMKYKSTKFLRVKKKIGLSRFEHDIAVRKCRLLLENWGFVENWISQRYISKKHYLERFKKKSKSFPLADGCCNFKDTNFKINFELERSIKKSSTYKDKIERIDNKADASKTLWLWAYRKKKIRNRIIKSLDDNDVNHFFIPMKSIFKLDNSNEKTLNVEDQNKNSIPFSDMVNYIE